MGGIECGMNSRQIAMNCGARISDERKGGGSSNAVADFAVYHGIKIPIIHGRLAREAKSVRRTKEKAMFLGRGDYEFPTAFNIFNTPPDNDQLFGFGGE